MEQETHNRKESIQNNSHGFTGPHTSAVTDRKNQIAEINDEDEYLSVLAGVFDNFDFLSAMIEAEELYELDAAANEEYFEFIIGATFGAPDEKDPGEEITSNEGEII